MNYKKDEKIVFKQNGKTDSGTITALLSDKYLVQTDSGSGIFVKDEEILPNESQALEKSLNKKLFLYIGGALLALILLRKRK
jgi:hypothetical protein